MDAWARFGLGMPASVLARLISAFLAPPDAHLSTAYWIEPAGFLLTVGFYRDIMQHSTVYCE
jgi:hypothetical protein